VMGREGFLKVPEVGRPIRYQPDAHYLRRADNGEALIQFNWVWRYGHAA
jgi:hypothetical protein